MRQLTEKQQRFLDVLFSKDCKGDPNKAAGKAGYAPETPTSSIVASLHEEILELTKKFLAGQSSKAAYSMSNVLDEPDQLGVKEVMVAAKDILDRAGLKGKDTVEIKNENPLFILPPKQASE